MDYENITTETFSKRLKMLRNEKGLSQEKLGEKVGLSKATISKYENSHNVPKIRHAKAIADAMKVSFNWLIGFSDEMYKIENFKLTEIYTQLSNEGKKELYNYGNYLLSNEQLKYPEELCEVPLLGKSAAGEPISYGDLQYEEAVLKTVPGEADFALSITGDSMEPLIKDNSIVFVKSQPTLENGQIGILEVDGEVTCKKFYKIKDKVQLKSINKKYAPITNFENIKIIGRVII